MHLFTHITDESTEAQTLFSASEGVKAEAEPRRRRHLLGISGNVDWFLCPSDSE